ncbi:helix-turn-helix domain-containing protein [Enterococcus casseliflavus]|nr:helix-turn-helix domain-containing protein [Enterococcus casseliflavus]
MDKKELIHSLYSFTESELAYRSHPEKREQFFRQFSEEIPTFGLINFDSKNKFFPNERRNLFKNSTIEFIQHTRFSKPPLHKHNHIEMTYVYRGSCLQVIHGEEIELTAGDFCVLDSNTVHTLYDANEEDIIINIVIQKKFFTDSFLSRLSNHSILSQFMIQALSEKNVHESFLIFHAREAAPLHEIMEQMLIEYCRHDSYTTEVLASFLFIFLTTVLRQTSSMKREDISERSNILSILKYIEEHADDCSLKHLAELFNYHPNYVSKLLKNQTGKSYQELIVSQKMKKAKYLLLHTDESIQEISLAIGYHNLSFFYKKFHQETGTTPYQFRKDNQMNRTSG